MITTILKIIFLFFPITIILCEYAIVNDNQRSYLHYKFDNIDDDIFPRDINLNVSISRLLGTLLYSIDRNMNQLIVTLHDSVPPRLGVEFNKQQNIISMTELCGCERCLFEVLLIRITIINNYIYIRCNERNDHPIIIRKEKSLNKDYPIMFSGFNSSPESINEAHLWLVNTPDHNGVISNSHQTYGCIFNVKYNNQKIYFTDISKNVKRKCNRTCTENICNGGVCYETYNGRPICNCTKAFLFGRYCNDSIHPMNLKTKESQFVFDILKLSWINTTYNDILRLNNTNVNILLSSDKRELFFEYYYRNGHELKTKAIISNDYNQHIENICIVNFYRNIIDIKFLKNGTWDSVQIPTTRDLRMEVFDSLEIRSGDGVIGISYKYTHEYKFHKMDFNKYDDIPAQTMVNSLTSIIHFILELKQNQINETMVNSLTSIIHFILELKQNRTNETRVITSIIVTNQTKVFVIVIVILILILIIVVLTILFTKSKKIKRKCNHLKSGFNDNKIDTDRESEYFSGERNDSEESQSHSER